MNENQKEAIGKMRGLIYGNWQTCVTSAFAELGIADILYYASAPLTVEDLAKELKMDARVLLRFLRCCRQLRFVRIDQASTQLTLTSFGELLSSHHPYSHRDAARLNGAAFRYQPWGQLVEVLKSGDGGQFSPTHKTGSLAYLRDKPELLEVFQRAMTNLSVTENEQIAAAYDFTHYRHIVDVGAGHGSFIQAVLKHAPHLQGTLFDLPETLDSIDKSQLDNTHRFSLQPGDFFDSIPINGDIYTMKNILHNWPEEKVVQILKNAHRALTTSPGASVPKRLLIIEYLVPEDDTDSIVAWMDLNFFILVGGSDRTLKEYRQLFAACGFAVDRLIHTPSGRHIIELSAN